MTVDEGISEADCLQAHQVREVTP